MPISAGMGSIISGGLGAFASMRAGSSAAAGQRRANMMNYSMSRDQMAFQKFMATHAHRQEVKDLRAAGLNPILSGTGGRGADTPSGASAHMENPEAAGVSSAMDVLRTMSSAFLQSQQARNTEADTEKTKAETETERERPANVRESTGFLQQQSATSKATESNIYLDNALKEVGHKLQLSEIDKNKALTHLFQKQGLTQQAQTQLLGMDLQRGTQALNRAVLDGAFTKDGYDVYKSIVTEPLRILKDTDWKSDASLHYDRAKRGLSDFNERMKARARAPH